jgi:hydroxymethylpyrimidine pyrophosphatase-like HAD family hydrolase/membrane-associated phospholipid phosphatase
VPKRNHLNGVAGSPSLLLAAAVLLPALILAAITAEVVRGGGLGWDAETLALAHHLTSPPLDPVMLGLALLGSSTATLAISGLVVILLLAHGRPRDALFVTIAVAGAAEFAAAVTTLVNHLDPGVSAYSDAFSYPSARSTDSTAIVVALVLISRRTRWHGPVLAIGLPITLGIGLSRLYLGENYASHVLAGWCVALAWVAALHAVATARERIADRTADARSLREPDLFLSFEAMSERLLARLRDAPRMPDAALDNFLLAAGMSQVLEDWQQRDVLALNRAAAHLPALPAAVARAVACAGHRLRAWGPVHRGLATRQRELAALVAALADPVARGCGNGPRAAEAAAALGPLDHFPPGVRRGVQRLPNCFRSFDQRPEDCRRLVERFAARHPNRARPLLVVGLRTSGSYLAPLHASFLAAAGYADVSVITLRPGAPLGQAQIRAVRAAAAGGGLALLVDDPPRTGAQLDRAAVELQRRGLADVVLVLQLAGDGDSLPERLRRHESVVLPGREWTIHDRLREAPVRAALESLLGADVSVRSIDRLPPRRGHAGARIAARLRDRESGRETGVELYAEGVGAGYFGRHALAVAERLPERVPPTYGVRDGLLFRDWLPEPSRLTPQRLRDERDAVADTIACYVEGRSRRLASDEDVTLRLGGREAAWEHVGQMLGHAFGAARQFVRPVTYAAARRLARVDRPSVGDGRTSPWEWFGDDPARLRKVGFQQRAASNAGFQSCDPVFDLADAAAAAEAAGETGFEAALRRRYETLTGTTVDAERWVLYRLLHHLGEYRSALREAAAAPPHADAAFERALGLERTMARVQREYLAEHFLADLDPSADGALCALDIDGVLETRWVAFPALAPAGGLALRGLHAHGYRPVLVSGRSLQEVRARCAAYRLPGAVGEYGAVLYDHRSGREHSLLTSADEQALSALRRALEDRDGVFLDPAYRHCVRVHRLGSDGGRGGLAPEAIAAALAEAGVEERVRVVPGALQTDFVPAGVDKGRGLTALTDLLGGPPVAMAVGDSAADLPMLDLAASAFAPANAAPELRGRARVLRAPYGAGLLAAVRSLVGHRSCHACCAPRPQGPDRRVLVTALGALDGGKGAKALRALALAGRLMGPAR